MKIVIAVAIIALSLCSCRGKSSRTSDPLDSRAADEFVSIALSQDNKAGALDIVAYTQIIRLDSNNGLIGRIKNTIVTDSNIVISDENSVFVFDRQGASQARVSRLGRGPEDYLQLTHMTLTPEGDKIVIYDNYGNKVLYFSLDGEYLSSTPGKFRFGKMEYVSSDEIVCNTYGWQEDPELSDYRDKEDVVYFVNNRFEIEESSIPIGYDTDKFRYISPVLHKFGGNVYVIPVFCDTIYIARNNILEPLYHVDMSRIGGEANFADGITNVEYDALVQRSTTFGGSFVDANDHLLISVSTPPDGRIDFYLYSKKSDINYYIPPKPLKPEEIVNSYIRSATTTYQDTFVSVIDAYLIAGTLERSPNVLPELAGIREEDNPVVIFYTLKDDL